MYESGANRLYGIAKLIGDKSKGKASPPRQSDCLICCACADYAFLYFSNFLDNITGFIV
jgi:hypothetical protein